MFWYFGHEACGILAPQPGIEPTPPALEGKVLTTGPPGKSLFFFPSEANFLVGLRSGLFPPGPAATKSWGEGLLCCPQHVHRIQTQHGGLTGPPSVTAARPLLAPHFLNHSSYTWPRDSAP